MPRAGLPVVAFLLVCIVVIEFIQQRRSKARRYPSSPLKKPGAEATVRKLEAISAKAVADRLRVLDEARPAHPDALARKRERGFREFKWWLGHPRLYRLVGFRWMCWRYSSVGVGIPDPRPASQEALDLGRKLARKHGWENHD